MIVRFGVEKLSLRKAGEKKRDQLTHIFLCCGVNVTGNYFCFFSDRADLACGADPVAAEV